MNQRPNDTAPDRLDQIPTQWNLLRIAHRNSVTGAGAARNALVLRYAAAIRNYVGALVKNDHDADEVAQVVVIRLLRCKFASASPERGSFRRMLMVATHNIEEIALGFDDPTPEQVEDELIETGLMPYVQDLLPADWRTRGELNEEE
jgi:hypothetical protein